MRRLLAFLGLALGLGLGFHTPAAHAQNIGCGVNFTPQVGVNCANVRAATYVGQILGLVPAASATDVWCIDGSPSKNVHIRRIVLSGTQTTAGTIPITVIRRNTLDTGGTSSTPNMTMLNAANPPATATLIQYTANPTITDSTSHQTMRAAELSLLAPATAAANIPLVIEFGTSVDAYDQGGDIVKGATAQQICINWGAATTAGNSLWGTVEWTED